MDETFHCIEYVLMLKCIWEVNGDGYDKVP